MEKIVAGCPEPAKQIFLENLIDFLRSKMSLMPTKTGPSVLKRFVAEEERFVPALPMIIFPGAVQIALLLNLFISSVLIFQP